MYNAMRFSWISMQNWRRRLSEVAGVKMSAHRAFAQDVHTGPRAEFCKRTDVIIGDQHEVMLQSVGHNGGDDVL